MHDRSPLLGPLSLTTAVQAYTACIMLNSSCTASHHQLSVDPLSDFRACNVFTSLNFVGSAIRHRRLFRVGYHNIVVMERCTGTLPVEYLVSSCGNEAYTCKSVILFIDAIGWELRAYPVCMISGV